MLPELFLKTQGFRGCFESMTYTSFQDPCKLNSMFKVSSAILLTNKLVSGNFSKEIVLTKVLFSDRFRLITAHFIESLNKVR